MLFTVLHGTFHIEAKTPEGRSLSFRVNTPEHVLNLKQGGEFALHSQEFTLQLEGLSHLDFEYREQSPPSSTRLVMTQGLWSFLGIRRVLLNHDGSFVQEAEDGTPGFVLTRHFESTQNLRGFAFTGATSFEDGSEVYLDTNLLRRSLNFQLLEEGLAYPDFTPSLKAEVRTELAEVSCVARKEQRGVWREDRSDCSGFLLEEFDRTPLHPRLFRWIVEFQEESKPGPSFFDFLRLRHEKVLYVTTVDFLSLEEVFVEKESRLHWKYPLESLVFLTSSEV